MPKSDVVRVTGFFRSKRNPSMFVGGMKATELLELRTLLKQAADTGKGVTFFLWKNDKPGAPVLSLQALIAQDYPRAAPKTPAKREIVQRDPDPDNVVDDLDL
jgi:hypothetical protein